MGGVIERDPVGAASERFDLAVVGGGIQGVSLALEASRRGLKTVLLERGDFGGGTTWNNLRIVHGGFRYLQDLDIGRFRDSVKERRWFLHNFPELVEPLPCLMPLYGRGLRRPWVFRAALLMNDLLSKDRNRGLRDDSRIPRGRVLGPDETKAAFPAVEAGGLQGGVLWFDAFAPDSQRLVIEMARWASSRGARLLNYVEAVGMRTRDGAAEAVEARDAVSGRSLAYRADVVVNCAGPWCREVASRLDRDVESLFRPLLLFNLLLDRAPLSAYALAVESPRGSRTTFFLVPWKGRILVGTYHVPRPEGFRDGPPERELVDRFLEELNAALPVLGLTETEVLEVYWGLLPAASAGGTRLAVRARIHDHGQEGGTRRLFSVSGVKFTTARRVAERTLHRIYGRLGEPSPEADERPLGRCILWEEFGPLLSSDPAAAAVLVDQLVEEEAVVYVEDLLLRRTDWGIHPDAPADVAARILDLRPSLQAAASST